MTDVLWVIVGIFIGAGHDKKDQAIAAIQAILKKYQKEGLSSLIPMEKRQEYVFYKKQKLNF